LRTLKLTKNPLRTLKLVSFENFTSKLNEIELEFLRNGTSANFSSIDSLIELNLEFPNIQELKIRSSIGFK